MSGVLSVAAPAVGIAIAYVLYARVLPGLVARFHAAVAHERDHGNVMILDRMRAALRRHPAMTHVMRAETMRGWVWVSMLHDAPDPTVVKTGWAPTKRLAQRQLDRSLPATSRGVASSARR